MVKAGHPTLSSYSLDLLSRGRITFSRTEAEHALGVGRGAFWDAAERLQHKGRLVKPRQGFYVVVPEQFRSWGAPPPSWYIDDLMQREGHPYYVGLLKAAELHGAAHQAVMQFQVITDRRMPEIHAGRSLIGFYYRRDMAAVANAIEDRKTDTGKMKISSAALTAFDLLRYPRAAGGLDHTVGVLSELAEAINPRKLAALAPVFERPVTQRLGYLLEHSGRADLTKVLHRHLARNTPGPWVELDPMSAGDPDLSPAPTERNERWRVIVRRAPEADA